MDEAFILALADTRQILGKIQAQVRKLEVKGDQLPPRNSHFEQQRIFKNEQP